MAKKETAVAVKLSDEALQALKQDFPMEDTYQTVLLPRISMASQDVTEGKGKSMKVVTEAGTFFTEIQDEEETDENGKKVWNKDEIGTELEAVILFQRKQLRYYNESDETYTSSPVYDSDDEIIPLFCNKAEVARDTPVNLKAREEFQAVREGKQYSRLEDNRILYVLYDKKIFQINLRGSSMYSYMTYVRELNKKGTLPPAVVTKFSSEPMEKGSIEWNKMTFVDIRPVTEAEYQTINLHIQEIKAGIAEQKRFFATKAAQKSEADEEFNKM